MLPHILHHDWINTSHRFRNSHICSLAGSHCCYYCLWWSTSTTTTGTLEHSCPHFLIGYDRLHRHTHTPEQPRKRPFGLSTARVHHLSGGKLVLFSDHLRKHPPSWGKNSTHLTTTNVFRRLPDEPESSPPVGKADHVRDFVTWFTVCRRQTGFPCCFSAFAFVCRKIRKSRVVLCAAHLIPVFHCPKFELQMSFVDRLKISSFTMFSCTALAGLRKLLPLEVCYRCTISMSLMPTDKCLLTHTLL